MALPKSFLLMDNPYSGGNLDSRYVQGQITRVTNALDRKMIPYTLVHGYPDEIIRDVGTHFEGILSFGGDGSNNHIVNAFTPEQLATKTLALFSRGTGNDGLGSIHGRQMSLEESVDCFIAGIETPETYTRKVDYFKCDFDGHSQYGVNFAGFGFVAEINAMTTTWLKDHLKGLNAYKAGFVKAWVRRYRRVWADIKGGESGKMISIIIANGKYAGGGMTPTPDAVPDDGELNMFWLSPTGWARLPFLFPSVIPGEHKDMEWARFSQSPVYEFEFAKPLRAQIDGEMMEDKIKHAKIEVIPGGLTVLAPR